MKKIFIILLSVLTFVSSSCSQLNQNEMTVANNTFGKLAEAIQSKDSAEIQKMFSKKSKKESDFEENLECLLEFIQGNVLSYSAKVHSVPCIYEYGKMKKEITSTCVLTTTEKVYYVALKECVKDDFDKENEGIVSLYIIESKQWNDEYLYTGDGNWISGINIKK
ncbi:MAG: DUF5104 domain-containing protein [Ruminococcaceae bacterium]|nr:DUF5104 domain-containing protein [Oscillospiraceae bacterium]